MSFQKNQDAVGMGTMYQTNTNLDPGVCHKNQRPHPPKLMLVKGAADFLKPILFYDISQ
jgi:hypothetical protein